MDVVQDSFQPKSKRITFHTIIFSAFKTHTIISHYVDSKDTKLNDVGILIIRYTYIMCSMIFSGFGVILGRYPTFINSYHHCNFLHMYSAQPPGPYPGVYMTSWVEVYLAKVQWCFCISSQEWVPYKT